MMADIESQFCIKVGKAHRNITAEKYLLSEQQLLPETQSAYRLFHLTETALTAVVDKIAIAIDAGQVLIIGPVGPQCITSEYPSHIAIYYSGRCRHLPRMYMQEARLSSAYVRL